MTIMSQQSRRFLSILKLRALAFEETSTLVVNVVQKDMTNV